MIELKLRYPTSNAIAKGTNPAFPFWRSTERKTCQRLLLLQIWFAGISLGKALACIVQIGARKVLESECSHVQLHCSRPPTWSWQYVATPDLQLMAAEDLLQCPFSSPCHHIYRGARQCLRLITLIRRLCTLGTKLLQLIYLLWGAKLLYATSVWYGPFLQLLSLAKPHKGLEIFSLTILSFWWLDPLVLFASLFSAPNILKVLQIYEDPFTLEWG